MCMYRNANMYLYGDTHVMYIGPRGCVDKLANLDCRVWWVRISPRANLTKELVIVGVATFFLLSQIVGCAYQLYPGQH